ncbi:hypothetical protein [Streptomyces sp. NPDC001985]|uniref:hypothetical protein n=1 Tax=Streptomyces sp. NPDC001985 TaxID=3154406 RepID=UPI00331B27FE
MIRADSVNAVARRGRLGRTTRTVAGWRGRRDGARGVPRVPLTPADGPPAGPADTDLLLVTPYVTEVRETARRTTEQMRSALILRKRELIARLRSESVRVVNQYDIRAEPLPAALARYGHWVGEWRTSTDLCRSRAQAVIDRSNQQLACYWEAVWITHPQLSRLGRRPSADWLPGRTALDDSWRRPEIWLLDDDETDSTATSRALRILDRQMPGSAGRRTTR